MPPCPGRILAASFAPAPRFWEMEEARVAYGLMSAGPTDIAQLMMIEYANTYGNDWYVVPLTIPVGSLTRVDSLVVTDTFGVQSLLRPIGDPQLPKPYWSMWQPGLAVGQALASRGRTRRRTASWRWRPCGCASGCSRTS